MDDDQFWWRNALIASESGYNVITNDVHPKIAVIPISQLAFTLRQLAHHEPNKQKRLSLYERAFEKGIESIRYAEKHRNQGLRIPGKMIGFLKHVVYTALGESEDDAYSDSWKERYSEIGTGPYIDKRRFGGGRKNNRQYRRD